jgi:hypothetical protein
MVTYKLLIENVRNKLQALNIPQREFPAILNTYLPLNERINEGRPGEVQVNRWLANGHHRQTIARGDIVLAMYQYIYFPHEKHRAPIIRTETDRTDKDRTNSCGVVYGDTKGV